MILSVGHSTHSEAEFAALLVDVDVLLDVRSHPTSRWEQHQQINLREWLPRHGVEYAWEPRLGGWTADHVEEWGEVMLAKGVDVAAYSGGRFPKQVISRKLPQRSTATWTNRGLYDYSWFTVLPAFQQALAELVSLSSLNVAMMCAEALWWRCHRSLVADVLWHRFAVDAQHLKPKRPKAADPAVPHSRFVQERIPRYETEIVQAWHGGGLSEQLRLTPSDAGA